MMIILPFAAVALFPLSLATPHLNAGVIHVPIVQRNQPNRVANLPKVVQALRNKYSYEATMKSAKSKRGTSAAIPLADEVCKLHLLCNSWN